MALEEKINQEIKTAMLAKNEAALRALRAVKSAILLAKTSGSSGLTVDDEMKILQKLVKQRKESIDIYVSQGREDLAKGEKDEVEIIEKFLPKQLGEDEIRSELKTLIEQSGAKSAAEMGKVMGLASKHFAGRADNRLVSSLLKEMLAGS